MQFASSLGVKHPEMVRLEAAIKVAENELAMEVAKTVESVRQEYLAAESREKELTVALDSQKASALALNRQGIEYGVLLRQVESDRQIYQSLLQRANETAVSSNLQGSNIEVVDPAEVPRVPVSPNTRSNLLIGLLLSAILAVAMALLGEAAGQPDPDALGRQGHAAGSLPRHPAAREQTNDSKEARCS